MTKNSVKEAGTVQENQRQTDYSYEKLVALFKTGQGRRCLILNEIGVVLWQGGKDAIKAESFLVGLLDDEDPEDKLYALCYLLSTDNLGPDAKKKLEEFEAEKANAELLRMAKGAVISRSATMS